MTNITYMFGSYIMFHYVRGVPFEFNAGAYDNLNMWEQIDDGAQYTPAKKFLLSVPIVLFLLSTHYTHYDLTYFTINFLAVLGVIIPKLPYVSSFFPTSVCGGSGLYPLADILYYAYSSTECELVSFPGYQMNRLHLGQNQNQAFWLMDLRTRWQKIGSCGRWYSRHDYRLGLLAHPKVRWAGGQRSRRSLNGVCVNSATAASGSATRYWLRLLLCLIGGDGGASSHVDRTASTCRGQYGRAG